MAVIDSPGAGRVLIALADGPLVALPTWTRYDNLTTCRCYGFDSYAGRQTELDTTDTGNATVYFHDQDGTLDDSDLVGLQIMLQLYNPVLAEWEIRWRGHIDDIQHELVDVPGVPMANAAVTAVGIFDYLGNVKMLPGIFGFPGSSPTDDVVFYEDQNFDDRCISLLDDANIDVDMRVTFTGNVSLNETLYDPDDVILQAIRDATDAEFPSGVSQGYEDRYGRVAIHGRYARIDPVGTAGAEANWEFNEWDAATNEDVTAGVAQIRSFSFNRPRTRIINSYLAYPRADEAGVDFDRSLIPTLLATDAGSISTYGYRGMEAPDLIIKENITNANTGAQECALFGEFYVANYSTIRKAIQQVSFMSHVPTDSRAAATYDLICRADISDTITLTVDEASIAAETYFIDGINIECRVLNTGYDFVTMTPNLTPASYFDTGIFVP